MDEILDNLFSDFCLLEYQIEIYSLKSAWLFSLHLENATMSYERELASQIED